jgi:putative protein-disulfide isomerase
MRKVFISFFLFSFISLMGQTSVSRIIYVGDPMCSWCYGFGGELTKFLTNHPDLELEIVMGGLRPHGTESMASLKDFLKEHWEEIHERTGMPFKYGILDEEMMYNTEPACRAVVVFSQMMPNKTMDFFKSIQQSFYRDNRSPHKIETYLHLLDQFGADKEEFKNKFESADGLLDTNIHFKRAESLGVRSFPTLLIELNGELMVLARGYTTAENLEKTLKSKLN